VAIYTLKRTQVVRVRLKQCWDFFSNPHNLEKITPPSLNFRIKTDLPDEIYPGLMLEYNVSPLLGIPISWLTEIVQVDKPHHFVDEQRIGPYRLWHHEHFFREIGPREVEVRDLIHYVPPGGPIGALINAVAIRPQLNRIFDFRAEALERMAQGAAADSFA
jgi:ligand-binding SRPBCC domain-containing protein